MAISEEQLSELRQKHGSATRLVAGDHEIAVKDPDRPSYKRFRAKGADPAKTAEALEQLVIDSLIHPSRDELIRMLDRKPGHADVFGRMVLEIAGLVTEDDAKKS